MTTKEIIDSAESALHAVTDGMTPKHTILSILVEHIQRYRDSEVAETKRLLGLCKLMQDSSVDMLCAKDDEIEAIKAEIANLKTQLTRRLETQLTRRLETQREMNAIHKGLKAEIERLRGELTKIKHAELGGFEDWHDLCARMGDIADKALLSPADGDGKPNQCPNCNNGCEWCNSELPAPDVFCPKCNSSRVEDIGVGGNAGTLYQCWECHNEWENEL